MRKDSCPLVHQEIKWDFLGRPSNPLQYKNITWFGEFLFDSLFFHRTQLTYKTKFKRILATTVLIFHEAFLGIIGNEPFFKYKDSTHHTFLQKSISVISETQLSMETFRKWQDEVIAGFNKNIWLVIDISKFGRGFVKRYVGSRCVVSVIDGKG